MTSIASLTQSIDTLAENSTAMFTAMLDAKDREHGEIEAEQAKANAEFEARKARNRAEKEKIGEWGRVQADDIRAILEGDQ
mgnify:CR=1 FL=1